MRFPKLILFYAALALVSASCSGGSDEMPTQKEFEQSQANSPDIDATKS